MGEKLLLVVSFGTTHGGTCQKNIGAVEEALAAALPAYEVRRAFTSGIIRRVLERRGTAVDDVPAALQKARAEGFKEVVLQPTHLLYGDEYEKMAGQAAAFEGAFSRLCIAKPLLAGTEDMQAVAAAVAEAFLRREKTALVLMGHGTTHYVNPVYAALQTVFRLSGREDIFVGTVEAWPGLGEVRSQLAGHDYKTVRLTPFMLVAGDHAENDMASDQKDSWKTLLQSDGYRVEPTLRGLGEYPAVRALYVQHAEEAAKSAPPPLA